MVRKKRKAPELKPVTRKQLTAIEKEHLGLTRTGSIDMHTRIVAGMTKRKAQELFTQFMYMSLSELKEIIENDTLPVIQHMVARVCYSGIREGNEKKLNMMLDRVIGKVAEAKRIDINVVNKLSDQELLARAEEAKNILAAEIIDEQEVHSEKSTL